MSVIRPEFHTSLVSQIFEDIFYQRSSYFYFLGKIDLWNVSDTPPTSPLNTVEQDNIVRDNIVYMRRISPTETSMVILRNQWESGATYTQWDHTQEMKGTSFFVVTPEYNVYKCLDNNLGGASTIEPSGTPLEPFRTADGYLWKYMYNIPIFKRNKFVSGNRIPVQRALTDTFYSKGAVNTVAVLDEGAGYISIPLTTITVTGTTTGTGASAAIDAVGPLGEITGLLINNGGSDYIAGATVTVTSSTGIGAVIEITQTGGVIDGFTIVQGGYGYSLSDSISIDVGGAEIIPVVSPTTGSILKTVIKSPGSGYTTAPTLTINQTPATGTGKYGTNPGAVVKAVIDGGSIVNVTIEDPGVGYPTDTDTTIVVTGDGSGASFVPVVSDGRVIDVAVEDPGSDYSYIKLEVVGDGSGATLRGVIEESDFLSDQSLIEQTAVNGAIYNVVVTNPSLNNNYSQATTVTIAGDGTGATAHVEIEGTSITRVVMNSYGSGYTYATVVFTDVNRIEPNSFVDAAAYAILPPVRGHGFNAVTELYSDTLSISTLLRDDVELNLVGQDYRQFGLIKNPTSILTNNRITTSQNLIQFTVTVADVKSMALDDLLLNNSKRYRVISINGNTINLQQLNSIYSVPSGVLTDAQNPAVTYNIQSVLSTPTANKYSGSLLYVTNREAFTPTEDQSIAIRTYIKI